MLCMAKYLLDSNVIIDYLRKEKNVLRRIDEIRESGELLAICSHVYYEVVRGFKGDENSRRFRAFLTLYKSWKIFPFDNQILIRTSANRAFHKISSLT